MKIAELKNKSRDELKDLALGLKKELFNLRFQRAAGELANHNRFKEVRRDIARIKTAMNLSDEQKSAMSDAPAKKEKKAAKPKAEKKPAKAKKAKE